VPDSIYSVSLNAAQQAVLDRARSALILTHTGWIEMALAQALPPHATYGCAQQAKRLLAARSHLTAAQALLAFPQDLPKNLLDLSALAIGPRTQFTVTLGRQIVSALDFLERLYMGQSTEIAVLRQHLPGSCPVDTERARNHLHDASYHLTGLSGYWSIRSPILPPEAHISYDLHQVIRHGLAHGENPGGGWTFEYDTPIHTGPEPQATITRLSPPAHCEK
jgi:hypothetical protein